MKDILAKLGGRKFLVAVFGLVAVVVCALTGVDIEKYKEPFMTVIGGYLLGQGFADGMSGGSTSSTPPKSNDVG